MSGEFSKFRPSQFTANLKEKDRFSQAFNILLNYWEIKPSQYEARLQELALKDVRVVSTFVPWAHVETDIYHSLKKFVRAAFVARLHVRLFVMPELGVNYPNAGIPKDLLANVANLAVDRLGRVIYNHSAPNIFPLPSFSSAEVLKRFGNYLIKVGSILSEVFAEVGSSDFCEIVVSNALFNYYRSHGLKREEHGDYSAANVMAFRDFLDREYRSGASAIGPDGKPVNDGEQFKTQLYESYNRHRFFTHIEALLREKTDMVFARKNSSCVVRHVDVFNPECATESAYNGLICEIFDFKPSAQSYYDSVIAGGYRDETIYLGNSGVFRKFNDQEKSFLMLAALIHSGEVSVLAEEFFKLSNGFHSKLRSLVELLDEQQYRKPHQITYVSASKFSMESISFEILAAMGAGNLSVVAGFEAHQRRFSERLIFLDPRSVIRMVELVQVLSLAQTGKVVAIPMPMNAAQTGAPNYMADAIAHLDKFKKGRRSLKVNIGLPYEIYEYQLGQVVFYDPQCFWNGSRPAEISRFFQALIGLAEVQNFCTLSDPRVYATSYVSDDDTTSRILFLVNPTSEPIQLSLQFNDSVQLTPLPVGSMDPINGKVFELAVPALGVLSMQITDVGVSVFAEPKKPEVPQWT